MNKVDELSPYILNTNTNIIFKLVDNPFHPINKFSKYMKKHKYYVRVKDNQSLDYNKTFNIQNVKKYFSKGYFKICNNYIHAKYLQAVSRMEKNKDNVENYSHWKTIASNLLSQYPENMI